MVVLKNQQCHLNEEFLSFNSSFAPRLICLITGLSCEGYIICYNSYSEPLTAKNMINDNGNSFRFIIITLSLCSSLHGSRVAPLTHIQSCN